MILFHICMVFIGLFILFAVVSAENHMFFPNLRSGPVKIFIKGMIHCNKNPNSKLQFNFYLSKKSINETELKGNITLKALLDDSFTIRINMEIKDSIGGWKNHGYLIYSKKAFTTFKFLLGTEWPSFANSFHMKKIKSSILPGVYITDGYPVSDVLSKANVPKLFFYGSYRYYCEFLDASGNAEGCIGSDIDLKRPWESE